MVVHRNEPPDVLWRVIPTNTPRVLRHCAKCGTTRRFASSDKFRLNAQQMKLDVWLIYKCVVCDSTWKCTIVERSTVKQIGAELHLRFQENDKELAWTCAFDYNLMSRAGVQIDTAVDVEIVRTPLKTLEDGQEWIRIRLDLTHSGVIRLDRLLAQQLNVSRSRLQSWHDSGQLRVEPDEKNSLRKLARSGQIISVLRAVWR
ncbi:MAG TPA: DUF1062 domain-containing protein [Terriglobia bacterium]|nr:DUF1062 domain-containing protein [Terriglobia bacterium]